MGTIIALRELITILNSTEQNVNKQMKDASDTKLIKIQYNYKSYRQLLTGQWDKIIYETIIKNLKSI